MFLSVIMLDKLLLENFFSNLSCPLNSEIKNINFQMYSTKNLKFIKHYFFSNLYCIKVKNMRS